MPEFQTSPGMRDLLAPDSTRARRFVEVFAEIVEAAGYGQVVPPLLEDIGVFARIGDATDVVSKEMYDFTDKGGRHIALRPEQTASVCRAFVQHRPLLPWKTWYAGPNFRYEKPQRGRYRQFEQVGIEVLGVDDPLLDVEVIALGWEFFERLGLTGVTLVLNSLGEPQDRARYVDALRAHFGSVDGELSAASRETLARNPLRVLDSKRPEDAPLIASAPRIDSFWSQPAGRHVERVQQGLRSIGVPFELDPLLVRGLDYYRRTTFEFRAASLESAQNAVGGGGRYDGLVEDLGGPATSGIGFALGVDRTLLACDDEGVFPPPTEDVEVFVVDTAGGDHALAITTELRRNGLSADRAFDGRSMKSQMKAADRSGARVAVIIGSEEVEQGAAVLRPLRSGAEQSTVSRADLLESIRKVLS